MDTVIINSDGILINDKGFKIQSEIGGEWKSYSEIAASIYSVNFTYFGSRVLIKNNILFCGTPSNSINGTSAGFVYICYLP